MNDTLTASQPTGVDSFRFARFRGVFAAVVISCCLASNPASAFAQAPTTVFKGVPNLKISEGGVERTPEPLANAVAVNLACVVSRIGDEYFWASRENVPLVMIESGAFITYLAVNGSGYVRVTKPELKAAVRQAGGAEAAFDYVEHLLIGLKSVTYYGSRAAQ